MDGTAAWCMTVYALVRKASICGHMAQTTVEEEKELLPLDLELFLAFIHLIQRAWIAWIIIIILCVIDLTLWNKEAASTVLHMIPAIVIALPIVVEPDAIVSWWTHDVDGVVWVVAWWPTHLARVGAPSHLSHWYCVASPTVLARFEAATAAATTSKLKLTS